MEDEKVVFHITGVNGEDIECEVIFTYEDLRKGRKYIAYTDNSEDETGSLRVFAGYIDMNSDRPELLPIETDEEWEVIDGILASLQPDDDEEDSLD